MEVEFKKTLWERFHIEEQDEEAVKQAVMTGTIETGNQLYEFLEARLKDGESHVMWNDIENTETYMDPSMNEWHATIEIKELDEEGRDGITWDNTMGPFGGEFVGLTTVPWTSEGCHPTQKGAHVYDRGKDMPYYFVGVSKKDDKQILISFTRTCGFAKNYVQFVKVPESA